jgi:glutathione S-transferase
MDTSAAPTVTLYGFPRSVYVIVARFALAAKGVPYAFHDTETEMYSETHLARHPFGRVPVLQHGEFQVYETSAIAIYIDEAFPGPALQPSDPRRRAKMHQWISSLSAYFYRYMVYYLNHERVVYPDLGIAPDEAVVAAALPEVERALTVMERELASGPGFLADAAPTLADYFLLPTITSLTLTPEGRPLLERFPAINGWRAAMGKLAPVQKVRTLVPPRSPIEHARRWATEHRPGVL